MEQLLNQIAAYKSEIEATHISDAKQAEEFRIKWLGTKGIVKAVMGEMKNVAPEKKKEAGQVLNEFKLFVEGKFETFKSATEQQQNGNANRIDLSLPGDEVITGSRHPVTLMRNRIVSIFQRLGFAVAEGPEIEDDWHNFGALNLPEHHPARDMQDTFYLSPEFLLRTQTSAGQIHVMEAKKPPIKVVSPGKVFRSDDDATHSPMFTQMEGLVVDKGITLCDLKGMLDQLVKKMFGKNV
ncbi:MAG TPA: phenylalanine--tRNA ligase subunit alpha, partial [Chitinophagaceae bacterium]|nr:phenylalanine--tRNA ligase subunit alpha [Chitinophagaceae bacterium]